MTKTITVSAVLYERLERTAAMSGFKNIEQLIEAWQAMEDEFMRRAHAAQNGVPGREKLFEYYGEQAALGRTDFLE